MRFDWYQATVKEDSRVVLDTVAKLGHRLISSDGMAKCYHYDQGFAVEHNERGIVGHVFVGGNGSKPHVLASSDSTDELVALVRQEWPENHLVTRVDASEDFIEAGAYERLRNVAKRVAREHRLKFPQIRDALDPSAGRTQYVGSPKSDIRCRIYEKGWEQVAKQQALFPKLKLDAGSFPTIRNTVTGEDVAPQDWIRAELQNRPKGDEARSCAAHATPEQVWAFSPWSQQLAREALALDLERVFIRTRKVSKDEETLRWMCLQYGALLNRYSQDLGDFACVGLEIERIIVEQTLEKMGHGKR